MQQPFVNLLRRALLAGPLPSYRWVPCALQASCSVKTAARKRASEAGASDPGESVIAATIKPKRSPKKKAPFSDDSIDETAAVSPSRTAKKSKSRSKADRSRSEVDAGSKLAMHIPSVSSRAGLQRHPSHPPGQPLWGSVPKGPQWTEPQDWVVFTDLHVKTQTLTTCLEVLKRVHAEAQQRKAGVLFLGAHAACTCMCHCQGSTPLPREDLRHTHLPCNAW